MGKTLVTDCITMSVKIIFLFSSAVVAVALGDTVSYKPFAGLEREIEMDSSVKTAMAQLNRYHGSGSYSYNSYNRPSSYHSSSSYYRPSNSYSSSYYRPSYNQQNYRPSSNQQSSGLLGNILTPVVFGLAAAPGLAAVNTLLPSTAIIGGK